MVTPSSGGAGFFEHIPVIGPPLSLLYQPYSQYFDTAKLLRQYAFNRAYPMVLPDVSSLISCYMQRIPEGDAPFNVKWIDTALQYHGVNIGQTMQGMAGDSDAEKDFWRSSYHAWRHVMHGMLAPPSAEAVMDAWRRGLITDGTERAKLRRAGGNVRLLEQALDWGLIRPSPGDVLDAIAADRIRWDGFGRAAMKTAGSDIDFWEPYLQTRWTRLGLFEAADLRNRGLITDERHEQYLKWAGYGDGDTRSLIQQLRFGLPSISDLLRMGSRQLFTPEIADRYGLYDGFEERSRVWFGKLGLDYAMGFPITVDGVQQEATLPNMYWGATREILSLSSAYAAYQRLREDQVDKYKYEVPNLRPFTIDDLRLHMRVAGYPPIMQDYLIALSHPPMGTRQIQWGVQFLGKDRTWAANRYMDIGYRADVSRELGDIAVARDLARRDAWIDGLVRSAHIETVKQVEGLYDDGLLDRSQAMHHLSDAGLPDALSSQLLDLSDARRARGLLREAIRATGRDYLSGVLSIGETTAALAALGITSARAGELMQIWTIRHSRRRKQATTEQILRWVGAGRMTVSDARARLVNLGWQDPDLLMLSEEAQAKLDTLRQKEAKALESLAEKRARQVARLAKDAQSEHKRLVTEANRIAPLSVLSRWLREGEMSETEFRDQLAARDYPAQDIDRYVADARRTKPSKPTVAKAGQVYPRPPGSRHPALGLLEKMYLTEVITVEQFRTALKEMGYGSDDTERIITVASLKHGAKGTTAEPPSPAPGSGG
jgi:hypothetical protein